MTPSVVNRAQIYQNNATRAQMMERISSLGEEIQLLSAQKIEAEEARDAAVNETAVLKAEYSATRERINNGDACIAKNRKIIEEQEQLSAELSSTINELRTEIALLGDTLQVLATTQEETNKKIIATHEILDSLEEKEHISKKILVDLEKEEQEKRNILQTMITEAEEVEKLSEKRKKDCDVREKELNDIKQNLDSYKERLNLYASRLNEQLEANGVKGNIPPI